MTYEEILDSWNEHCVGSPRYNDLIAQGFSLPEPSGVTPLPDDYFGGPGCAMVRGTFVLPNGKTKHWGVAHNPRNSLPLDADAWDQYLQHMATAWKLEKKG